ncbi:TPA: LuxR C-terminal-related transcriptional regulator [Streptococcus pyogenes]
MSEELKTIKELADELGITKQTVQYHIKNLPSKIRKKNSRGAILLTKEEQNFINSRVNKQSNREQSDREQSDREQSDREQSDREQSDREQSDREQSDREQFYLEKIKIQEEQIEDFKEQRIELRGQVKHLGMLLDQQQRLALQDKKLLEEYKAENDSLKALKMPSQETEFKHLDNQYKDEVNALKEHLETLQEQIKDQKRIEEQEKPRKWWELWRK